MPRAAAAAATAPAAGPAVTSLTKRRIAARLAPWMTASLVLTAASVQAQGQPAAQLPAGDGREIVAVACVQCHAATAFTQLRVGPEGWRFQVYDMILRGAQVNPAEIDRVVQYLTANFGPGINVPAPFTRAALPDGQGRGLVEQRCGLCHGVDRVAAARRSPSEWDAILARMAFLGAPIAGEDGQTIRAYLKEKLASR